MSVLIKASQVIGLPVVTLGGDDVAEVRDVVYDPAQGKLIGFTLNARGWLGRRMKDSLSWSGVVALGPDAVMIRDESELAATDEATPALSEPPTDRNVLGDAVLTDEGVQLGMVSDIIVETGERAEVVGYEIEDKSGDAKRAGPRFLPLPQQLAVSGDALLVPATVEPFLRDDLAGFGAAVDDFRELLGGGAT